ncbi:MAG: hypothetical protein HY457_00580 [Parcubacteria group bacterium]|nr:hypothetical protein [Parcubacteria group bacterium]
MIESVENGELKTWWDENKKRDARREAREAAARQRVAAKKAATQRKEALRKSGLAKLNDAEKEALGIKTSKKKR